MPNTTPTRALAPSNSSLNGDAEMMIGSFAAFESDNAKYLTVEQAANLFVHTPAFEQLLTRKNHILLGSRGSGKTMWIRMLSHDHLMRVANLRYARDALRDNFIGVYVRTNTSFVGSLKSKPWQSEAEAEEFFQWRLNLQTCSEALHVFRSCVAYYVTKKFDRHIIELEICSAISRLWSSNTETISTFSGLEDFILRAEVNYQTTLAQRRTGTALASGHRDIFQTELFFPFKLAMRIVSKQLSIPANAAWCLCLDEVEFLTESHHRILNTHLRTSADELFFKIATMPFAHHTLSTNTGKPVQPNHDFHYVSIDTNPINPAEPKRRAGGADEARGDTRRSDEEVSASASFFDFSSKVFARRARFALGWNRDAPSLQDILGNSALLDEKTVETPEAENEFFRLLGSYATNATILRANKLRGSSKFRSEILRKMHGALLLRHALSQFIGNAKLDVYSGTSMFVRCSDGNTRRLVQLFTKVLRQAVSEDKSVAPISRRVQNELLTGYANEALSLCQSLPPVGKELFLVLSVVGKQLKDRFVANPVSSDQVTSIEVGKDDGDAVHRIVRLAVQGSLLIPAGDQVLSHPNTPCEGIFHLAYVLAPHFHLLPRRNKSVRLLALIPAQAQAKLYGQIELPTGEM